MVSAETSGTPLQSAYTFLFMRRGKGAAKEKAAADAGAPPAPPDGKAKDAGGGEGATASSGVPYETSIKTLATVHTVEQFWDVYNHLIRPSDLPTTTDYHFFRDGIKPTWEDPSNAKGGKWIVRLRKGLASRYWEEIILAILGQQFAVPDGEVCGAVLSIRYSEDIVSVWNRTSSDRGSVDRIRDGIKKVLQLPGHVHLEYKPHQASLQDKSSFKNTQIWRPKDRADRGDSERGGARGVDRRGDRGGDVARNRSGSWTDRDELKGGGGSRTDQDRGPTAKTAAVQAARVEAAGSPPTGGRGVSLGTWEGWEELRTLLKPLGYPIGVRSSSSVSFSRTPHTCKRT